MKRTANEFDRVEEALKTNDYGFFIENEENGRSVVIECMAGGRYLCLDADNEVVKLTSCEREACVFLLGTTDTADRDL